MNQSFSELLSELLKSVDKIVSLPNDIENETLLEKFALFVEKLAPVLKDVKDNELMDTIPIRKAVESLGIELSRASGLIRKNSNYKASYSSVSVRQIEDLTHDIGRCLGLLLLATLDVSAEIKHKFGDLHKEMINARFNVLSVGGVSSSTEPEDQIQSIDSRIIDVEDVVLWLKNGSDEELTMALQQLGKMINHESPLLHDGWVIDHDIIPILINRLGSGKHGNTRLTIIELLRSLASVDDDNKEKMADVASVSTVVRSMTRDVEERREAVGLLLDLSEIPRVRQRFGRIQGCIVMLVSILNGEDPSASRDAGKLLTALSSSSQNVLHMAEAGYFKPLVQYLKKGSDMNKILMATALSRMELTEQSKVALGEEGSIEPLVKMFISGKLEAKLSALSALQNLSSLRENVQHFISAGLVAPLLELLFSVTSVLMTLREPASAILASIAQSELILINRDVAQQMLSLLNLSSPAIQYHLLQALNSIASHSSASKARAKMKENGGLQFLLPFLTNNDTKIRTVALNLVFNLSKDLAEEMTEQLGETHLNIIANIILALSSENEKTVAIGILSCIPVNDKRATEILKKANLLPILVSLLQVSTASSTHTSNQLLENIAAVLVRFTVPWDKKLQRTSVELGVIPLLVKLLSSGSPVAKSRAATSLAQLSQNTIALNKVKVSRWLCFTPSSEAFCEVHECYCFIKSSFCLVKSGAISPLVQILEGKEREADEAVLSALATLMVDEIWENGTKAIANASGVQAILRVLEVGSVKAQEKAVWILERVFRVETHRIQYGEPAQVLLIDLAQKGNPTLKSMTAKILAHLQLLRMQSSYF